jgi:hypothetical protein
MSRLIIENASYVVTVDATDTVLRDTTITIDDGSHHECHPGDAGGARTRRSPHNHASTRAASS